MKKLSISLDNDSDDVNYYTLEAFPKLKGAGGYELLRASSSCRSSYLPHRMGTLPHISRM